MKIITGAGQEILLGTTGTTPTIGLTDYSRRVTDDFGVTTVVKRGFARHLSVRCSVAFTDVDAVQRQLAGLRAAPAQWIADERFAWLSVQGFYKDFSLDLAVPPLSFCTLTVEGLAEEEAGADTGADAAPSGSSTLRLIQPIDVTGAVLASSSAPETDYPSWVSGTTYAAGVRVISTSTHRQYESAINGNIGHDPTAATGQWIDVGPTNRWAMFDQALGTATTSAGTITLTLNVVGVRAVALLDVSATSVRVQATGYDRTLPGGTGAITFLDMPVVNGQITVTVAGSSVSVGTLVLGPLVTLGVTEESPTAGITDYSRKEVDDFGEATVVPRSWAKRMAVRALIRTDALDLVANRIASVRALPSLWVADEGTDTLAVYGFFKDFSIEVGETVSKLALTIEGLSEAEPLPVSLYDRIATNTFPGAYLTNESHTVATAPDGTGASYVGAGGTFEVVTAVGDALGVVFSVVSEVGVDVSIDSSTGVYVVNSMSADQGVARFRALWQGFTIEKNYSIARSKAGAGGAAAKLLFLSSDRQTLYTDAAGAYAAGQTINFTAAKQNSTATVSWTLTDAAGVARTPATYLSATTGDSVTMTAAQFDAARNGTPGVIVKASMTDGTVFSDQLSVVRVSQGAVGTPGLNAVTPVLTNESATVGTAADGTSGDYTGAGGTFKMFLGNTDITTGSGVAYSLLTSTSGLAISIHATTGVYTVTGSTVDTGVATLRATYSGVNYDKVYSFAKSKAGAPGAVGGTGPGGPVIALTSDAQAFKFVDGAAVPAAQTITLTAIRQNTTETVNWSVVPAVTLGGSGLTRTIDLTAFGTNRQVVITAVGAITGVKDTITLVRLDQSTAVAGATRNADGANMIPSPVALDRTEQGNGAYGSDASNLGAGRPILFGKRIALPAVVGAYVVWDASTTAIPAIPGETLYTSCAAALDGTVTTDNLTLAINWQRSDGSPSVVMAGSVVASASGSQISAAGVLVLSGSAKAPSDAAFCRPYAQRTSAAQTGIMLVSEPYLGRQQQGADITYIVSGPAQSTVFKYDYLGTTPEAGEFNRDLTFKLMSSNGQVVSDVSWAMKTLTGSFNGIFNDPNYYAFAGSGSGTLTATSLQADESTLEIRATYGGKNYTLTPVKVTKSKPPNPNGSTIASQSSGFSNVGGATYVATTGTLSGTPLSTSAIINVTLQAKPVTGATGSWTVTFKVQKLIGGTWTDIGATASGSSSWNSADVSGDTAYVTLAVTDTVTANALVSYRVLGSTTGTRVHNVTGRVLVTG